MPLSVVAVAALPLSVLFGALVAVPSLLLLSELPQAARLSAITAVNPIANDFCIFVLTICLMPPNS
ncbi:hypothetical protein D3C81_1699130 [compost metagenome]